MKKLFALILAFALCLSLTALAIPASADGEIVINFPSIWVGTDSKAPYMAEMIEAFNAENAGSIKVVVEEQTDYQAYRDKIRTTITTGSAPDLCILDTTFDIKAFAESGKFMDLTPYLDEGWGNNFTDGAFDAWSVDGKVSILPFEAAVFTPIYNVEILKAAGWDHFPATYTEFFQMAEDVKAAGYNVMGQMAGDNAWTSMLWYSLLAEAIGGKDVYEDGLSNPAFVEAAKVLKEMYNYTFDGAVSAAASDVSGHFLARDTAIYLNGPWWIANLQGFLAAAKQDDPAKEAAVVKFLQYISEPERVANWALSSGAMFFVKYTPSPDTSVISQKVTEVANNAAYTILHVNGAFPTAFSTEFPAAVSALVLGEVDEQGFVDQLQLAIDMA